MDEVAEKEKLRSEFFKRYISYNSSCSPNNNNKTTAESLDMAEKGAESGGEGSPAKKFKFTDTTLSTKACKTMKWDDYRQYIDVSTYR